VVSIHRPLGYEPNALPLRHFAAMPVVIYDKNIPGGIRTPGLLLRKQTPYHWATGTVTTLGTRTPKRTFEVIGLRPVALLALAADNHIKVRMAERSKALV
jgi:hypothetical protein